MNGQAPDRNANSDVISSLMGNGNLYPDERSPEI
jgi:hypothetical protein